MTQVVNALMLTNETGVVRAELRPLLPAELPDHAVLVRVQYSSLNYKDGLAVAGRPGVIKSYPIVPGIDLVGEVLEDASGQFQAGAQVICTGWGIGERHWGGYAGLARLKPEWLVPLPKQLSPLQAMACGTAGLTAMLGVMALEEHGVRPDQGPVLVTGATGGVGSLSVALLAARGYAVTASTGRLEQQEYLEHLGARALMPREELSAPHKPLERERWAGAVDSVGGATLAAILAATRTHGSVAACGLAGGSALGTTVFPFILRGVNLLGVDSVNCPFEQRVRAWERLASDLNATLLSSVLSLHRLEELPALADQILAGQVRGRIVIDVNA